MKKNIFILSVVVLTGTSSLFAQQKQGVKLEGSIGIVLGDNNVKSASIFGLGLDATYLFDVKGSFQLGPTIGYHNFFGKKSTGPAAFNSGSGDDIQILPLAVSARYYLFEEFFVGSDIGYGLFLDNQFKDDSGFYLKPKIGFDFDGISTNLSYSTIIGENINFSAIQLGIELSF